MKLSKIVPGTYEQVEKLPRFDNKKMPQKQKLTWLAWLLSFPETIKRKCKITKINMKGLKPPYILLGNHSSFFDFKVATRAIFPHKANYIVAIDGFINREWLLRAVGGFCKRKFTNDIGLIKKMKHSLVKNKTILVFYPEARYSLCGTNSILPESLGKMIKMFKVPVVTLMCHGHHICQPIWDQKPRKVHTTAEMEQIINQQQIETMSVDEINKLLTEKIVYDDFAWQKENNVVIDLPERAKNLHKVLYQCPHCKDEKSMKSGGTKIWCEHCGKTYEMSKLGELKAESGETEFSHIPDWFKWEENNVAQQVVDGTYSVDIPVYVDTLPNSKGFYRLGVANFHHDMNGLKVEGTFEDGYNFKFVKAPLENYSAHIEYDYNGKGEFISFSTLDDTYYFYPINQPTIVTKLHFGVEQLYKHYSKKK